jgi:hypothetical protein
MRSCCRLSLKALGHALTSACTLGPPRSCSLSRVRSKNATRYVRVLRAAPSDDDAGHLEGCDCLQVGPSSILM